MRLIRLFLLYFRINALGEMAYRANFFMQFLESLLDLATAIAGLAVIFSYTKTLGGWRPDEVLALVGIFFIMGGAIRLFVQPAMEQLIESVRDGTLDFILTKPEDAQLLASIQRVEIWKVADIILGIGVVIVALVRLGNPISVVEMASFAVMFMCGGIIVYSFWLILASLSFWFVRVENILMVFQSMYEAGRWPVSIYPRWLRYGLTFLVPVAFATTVPAQALAGKVSPAWFTTTAALAIGFLLISRLIWRAGIKRYAGASS